MVEVCTLPINTAAALAILETCFMDSRRGMGVTNSSGNIFKLVDEHSNLTRPARHIYVGCT